MSAPVGWSDRAMGRPFQVVSLEYCEAEEASSSPLAFSHCSLESRHGRLS
jgi:hypothetical protein